MHYSLYVSLVKSFTSSLKIKIKALFTSFEIWNVDCSSPDPNVSSGEEFFHEKVTNISLPQWRCDKSGKSYRAALHSLQYLLPVLIIRLIKLQRGLPTVTFCFSGEGEAMANWGHEGRREGSPFTLLLRWIVVPQEGKETHAHQNKYVTCYWNDKVWEKNTWKFVLNKHFKKYYIYIYMH